METSSTYVHRHAAHCESGVVSSLLKHQGLELSEPMVFGLSGALNFAYLPFLRFGNMPLIAYRQYPGHIIKNLPKLLGVQYFRKRYSDPQQAMDELDGFLRDGHVAGIQTSAYFTPYFPPDMRFQFNAHNAIVIGKQNGQYLISDPVFEDIQRIDTADLRKARFARGLMAPKGLIHFPLEVPSSVTLEPLIRKSIQKTANMMLRAPLFIGLKGIKRLAASILKLGKSHDKVKVRHFLGNVVRMQEEIGTGGGGFRFIHAAFLQEAYQLLGIPLLQDASRKMTEAGDAWRNFALACAKVVKRKDQQIDLPMIAGLLNHCGELERELYLSLKTLKHY